MRCRAALVLLALLSSTAAAEPWYRGKYGRNRVTHLAVAGGLGLTWLATTTVLSDTLSPDSCRWCVPPSFDRGARNALVWSDRKRAGFLSDVSAFALGPAIGVGLLIASEHDSTASQVIDDVLPVLETAAAVQLVTNLAKIAFARSRPYVYFQSSPEVTNENNLSFWSGHSSFAFAITTSAGLIAHWRGYATEPYIWGAGITVSLATEYLRIAADRHYLSDVVVGGMVGVAGGLLVPRLMRRELPIVPTSNGAAVVGVF